MSAGVVLLAAAIVFPLSIRFIWALDRYVLPKKRDKEMFSPKNKETNHKDEGAKEERYVVSSPR
jgi:hypothetical protein